MHSIIIKILWFCFSKIPIIRFRPRSRLSITFQTMINVFWKLVFIYINGMCWQLYIQVHFPKTSLRLRLQITSNTKKSKQKIRCELRKWIFSWIVFIEFLERNKKSAHRIDWNINIQKGSGRSTIQFNCNMSDLLISNMSELNKLKIVRYWIMNENNDTNVSRQIALKYKKKNNQKTETIEQKKNSMEDTMNRQIRSHLFRSVELQHHCFRLWIEFLKSMFLNYKLLFLENLFFN